MGNSSRSARSYKQTLEDTEGLQCGKIEFQVEEFKFNLKLRGSRYFAGIDLEMILNYQVEHRLGIDFK